MNVWLDIENPPQVQYLSPFRGAFARAGCDVIVTARDHPFTRELLAQRGIDHLPVGVPVGASRPRKALAIAGRALTLRRRLAPFDPKLLVCASRASALAAASMGITGFAFCDYEYVDLRFARLARTYILHPDVIPAYEFTRRGIRQHRLMPFPGLKESISLAGVDVDAVPEAEIESLPARNGLIRVLVRPPAEESHYYRAQSKNLTLDLLDHLATLDEVAVLFSPRYDWQRGYLEQQQWRIRPVVLERAIPFVSLLKAVDVVVSSGGTMLREAAHLGVPAYSILRSEIGSVDRYLESIGRIGIIRNVEEARAIDLAKPRSQPLPVASDAALDGLASRMLDVADKH
jgi:predicted glycosyltransferase